MLHRKSVRIIIYCTLILVLLGTQVPAKSRTSLRNIYYYSRSHYSQYSEEFAIRTFFKNRRNGFFVDAGASHYSRNSTTYFLEQKLGWRGISVDPIDTFAEGYRKFRPGTRFFVYALSDRSGEMTDFFRGETIEDLSTLVPARVTTDMVKQRVQTITLNDLLAENGVERIDLLSMDIEGYETTALAAFDIRRYAPALVCIEAPLENGAKLMAYFRNNGYSRIESLSSLDDGLNWYFERLRNPLIAQD